MRDRASSKLKELALPESLPNIALRAYELWQAAGRPEGRSDEFYFQAEEEFRKMLEAETIKPEQIPSQSEEQRGPESIAVPRMASNKEASPDKGLPTSFRDAGE